MLYSFRVGIGVIAGLAASEHLVQKKGVVRTETQKGDNFVRGLFEADHALMLFRKLYIVAGLYNTVADQGLKKGVSTILHAHAHKHMGVDGACLCTHAKKLYKRQRRPPTLRG